MMPALLNLMLLHITILQLMIRWQELVVLTHLSHLSWTEKRFALPLFAHSVFINFIKNIGDGMHQTLSDFETFSNKYVSRADVIALGTIFAVASCEGPIIPFRGGRIDTYSAGPPGVPEPHQDLSTHTALFKRQGFDETDMITLVACGHTLGGVRSHDFPTIVPPNGDPTISNFKLFDSTHAFDNNVIVQYLDGMTENPLVTVGNATLRSDLRIFSSDSNDTVSRLASSETFMQSCSDVLERMLNTVPSDVTLTEPIDLLHAKVASSHLTIEQGEFVFKVTFRLTHPIGATIKSTRTVKILWCDRYGSNAQDQLLYIPSLSSVNLHGRNNKLKTYDIVAAVRSSAEPSRVYLDAFDNAMEGYLPPLNVTMDLKRTQLTVDLHTVINGHLFTEDFMQTFFIDENIPYTPPTAVQTTILPAPSPSASSSSGNGLGEYRSIPTIDPLDALVVQSAHEIFRHGVEETKCIAGRIHMAWDAQRNRKETLVQVPGELGQPPAMFRIYFQLPEEYLQLLGTMSSQDTFRLSLRGVKVEKLAQPPKSLSIAMQLVVSEGVHIYWERQGEDRKTLNTWLATSLGVVDDNNWFASPELASSTRPKGMGKRKHEDAEDPKPDVQESMGAKGGKKEAKKRMRLEAKRLRQAEAAKAKAEEDAKSSTLSKSPSPSTSAAPLKTRRISTGNGSASASPPAPTSARPSYSPLDLQAGCQFGLLTYVAMSKVRLNQTVHLIGIVTEASPPRTTRTGEWMRYLHIVDPSNYHPNGSGFKINCFAKRYEAWLPHPDPGDVLILQYVKISDYNSHCVGTGYSDKLRWAAFSPSKGTIHHGPGNTAPKEEGLAEGGFGVNFSPFLQPQADEITYCVKLSDWWGEVHKEKDASINTVVIPDAVHTAQKANIPRRRIHRLISDAGPHVPPDGYFDCTIEVLKGYPTNTHSALTYTLYVTDYTRNAEMRGVQSNWCPSSLSDYVLQLEMWDAAAVRAQKMRPGQYYYIENARMRTNTAGYPEGKVAQDKIHLLEEDDSANNAHLRALLERKQKWQSRQAIAEPDMQYQLMQDVVEAKFFHCTVVNVVINEPWAKDLSGRIVKITLSEEQKEVAESAVIGAFYSIRKLRLKYSVVEDCFCGFLGGNERLIVALNPNRTDNEHLNGLLRRQEEWEMTGPQKQDPPVPQHSIAEVEQNGAHTRIKDIPTVDAGPRVFRISARVVDYHPLDLQDAFYQFCKRCKLEIPNKYRACLRCSDSEYAYVQYVYQLYIMLEDEDQNQLVVSINNNSSLLNGLKRGCMPEDAQLRRAFSQRLKPVLGNLATVHNALRADKNIEVDTPWCIFEVDSWFMPEGRRAFSLKTYDVAS
ncbi:hypothetical protein NLJ89_g2773 [Agrocybe chaxingu]|uniref:Peroxidase n=1 Tax=Agrocybe chaxingu TaxID=84603 RepID=A0A9W8K6V5_9AGAR|nr:hypothetical protein NLJ89_g2773 [Agrocybe chaxingu]